MGNAIPIILLTGYLGAGKTTLLNHLLQMPFFGEQRLALIINEFGAIGVDGERVGPGAYAKFEINKGSIFCICVKTDFIKTLEAIVDDVRPDLVICEATGVAEPRDIEAFITEPHLHGRFRIEANVCVIDAEHFMKVLPMLKAVREQVAWADGFVVNRTDRAAAGELVNIQEILRESNPDTPVECVSFGRISDTFLKSLKHKHRVGDVVLAPPDPVFSESFEVERPIDKTAWRDLLLRHADHILRLKGYVDFGEGIQYVEVVGGDYSEAPADRQAGTGRFVVIAWHIRQGELRAEIESLWA